MALNYVITAYCPIIQVITEFDGWFIDLNMMIEIKNNLQTKYSWLLFTIFVLALFLRFYGISFGLPYEYHVDEDQYVRQAATMGSSGLNPADWFNPPFYKYLLLAEYGSLYLFGKALGWYTSTADFGAQMTLDPTWLYLLGRGTSALFGALTVLVTYFIGVKAYSRIVGLFSSALMAVAFLPVRESHFAVNDAAASFFITTALLGAVGITKNGTIRWYLLAGVASGLGFATKYHALAVVVPVILAHFLSPDISFRKPRLDKLLFFFTIATISAIVVSPYFFFSYQELLRDMIALSNAGQSGFLWEIDPDGGYLFYLKTLMWGMGWPLGSFAILAAIVAPFRRNRIDFVLLSFPWLVFLYLGSQEMFFGRFMLPVIALMIIVSISLLVEISSRVIRHSLWRKAALLSMLIILSIQPFAASIRFNSLITKEDTRAIAKEWIEQNLPEGTRVAMDWHFHCPPLSTMDRPIANSSKTYHVWMPEFGVGTGLVDNSLDWYRQNGYEYLVACSSLYNLVAMDKEQNQARIVFYSSLDRNLVLINEVYPSGTAKEPPFIFDEMYGPTISLWQRDRPGPVIKIYQLDLIQKSD
jgi:4-amino-4-deoxy-L-arabinose transferase-like glycosyltransferase